MNMQIELYAENGMFAVCIYANIDIFLDMSTVFKSDNL